MEKNMKPENESGNNICEFQIDGMHCPACEVLISDKVSGIEGVSKAQAHLKHNKLVIEITSDPEIEANIEGIKVQINEQLKPHGYKIHDASAKETKNTKELAVAFGVALGLIFVFLLLQKLGLSGLFNPEKMNLGGVFVIGVIASLSSCMAVVGGLVLALSADFSNTNSAKRPISIILFHMSRVISFFILGGVIGLIGKSFTLNPTSNFVLSIVLFAAMSINGLILLGTFKKLNKFSINLPPSFLKMITKRADQLSETSSIITPILLGTLTFFLPCGFTQSMQLYTLSSGSFLNGGLTMLVFALGTLPALAAVSFASVTLNNHKYSGIFYKTAGFLIIFFGLMNLYGGLVSVGIIQPFFNL